MSICVLLWKNTGRGAAFLPHGTRASRSACALRSWLAPHAPADGLAWLDAAASRIAAGAPDHVLFTRFSAAPRRVGNAELPPGTALGLAGWSADQAARVILLLHRPLDAGFLPALDRLFGAADPGELACLYQVLPLLPWPERYVARAAEGVRSNMLPVFVAVALGNPYPAAWLDEGAWNQMVLKAVFLGCPLDAVRGLDSRATPALARMLVDYARERRAARHPVAPELWLTLGRFGRGRARSGRAAAGPGGPGPRTAERRSSGALRQSRSGGAYNLGRAPGPGSRTVQLG